MIVEKLAFLVACVYAALVMGTILRILQTQCSLKTNQWLYVAFVPLFLIVIAPIMICSSKKDGLNLGELLRTYRRHIQFFPVFLKFFVDWACESNESVAKTYSHRNRQRSMNFLSASEKIIKNESIFA